MDNKLLSTPPTNKTEKLIVRYISLLCFQIYRILIQFCHLDTELIVLGKSENHLYASLTT